MSLQLRVIRFWQGSGHVCGLARVDALAIVAEECGVLAEVVTDAQAEARVFAGFPEHPTSH